MLKQYIEAIEKNNIVSKTDTSGIITYVSDEFCKISGYSREELLGKNHNIIRDPSVPSEKFKLLWDTIKSKQTYKATVKNRAKDGSVFYVNTTVIPLLDENDNIIEYIAIRYDITQEVKLREELEEKQKIIFWQSRLASIGQMLANVAHQWRQPLTQLNLTLFNLKKSFLKNNSEDVMKMYYESKEIIQHMSSTIDNFSNFFKPHKEKQAFFIKDSIIEALSILKKLIKTEQIIITKNLNNSKVLGIPNEFSQVIINLIQNSKDAWNDNQFNDTKHITISLIEEKEFIIITFEDNAGGIDPKIMDKIFEPYFTTKHASSGTGLGLFMSKMICEQAFDGSMSVANSQNGTIFTMKLPKIK